MQLEGPAGHAIPPWGGAKVGLSQGTQERSPRKHRRAQGSAFFCVYTGGLAEPQEHSTSK